MVVEGWVDFIYWWLSNSMDEPTPTGAFLSLIIVQLMVIGGWVDFIYWWLSNSMDEPTPTGAFLPLIIV